MFPTFCVSRYVRVVLPVVLITMAAWNPRIYAAEVQQWISTIKQVGPKGEGHAAATHAWNQLVKQDASQLLAILKGFDGANVHFLSQAFDRRHYCLSQ